ncbi:MAG: hypothetical protein JWO31_2308, partial [Phycisphaerales bacterium]|nr:hypothetical protein [Phycisphaerales bacterium]
PLRPFTAFAWHPPGPRPHVKPLFWVGNGQPAWAAAQTSKHMEDGTRVMLTTALVGDLLRNPEDLCRGPDGRPGTEMGVWPAAGTAAVAARVDAYFAAMAAAGGRVDHLALDFEDGYSNWGMTEARLAAIGADPRFPALAARLGFADPTKALLQRSGPGGEYLRWNAVTDRTVAAALNAAVTEPVRRHFPAAGVSNFGGAAMAPAHVLPDLNGHRQYTLGDPAGTHQAPAAYGEWAPANLPGDWSRPFMTVVYAANVARVGVLSGGQPVLPWVGFKSWTVDGPHRVTWGRTPYWEEGVVHTLLGGGADNLLFFNPADKLVRPPDDPTQGGARPADNDALEALMADLERQAGGHRVVAPLPAAAPVAWDASFVVSSARLADGSTLSRVTFAERAGHADLRVGDQTVRVQRPAGQVGAWVRVPAGLKGSAGEGK